MPSPRDMLMARTRAAQKTPAASPRTSVARSNLPVPAPSKPRPPHKRIEKRTLIGAICFIVARGATGSIYSGMATGPPEPKQTPLPIPGPMRIARILLPGTGAMCREVLFDNDTGFFSIEKAVSCEAPSPAQARVGTGSNTSLTQNGSVGFSSFKDAFGRK